MARKLQSIFLAGPAGRLEALLEEPESNGKIERAVVICHPHPQYGGTMHNKVVYRMAKAARGEGSAALRFNYRGVGTSSGTYDGGCGEQDDLRAAILYMRERHPGVPLVVGGFSFGARVALGVCCRDSRIEKVIAVGTPVNTGEWGILRSCGCPKHFVQSMLDEYGSRDNMQRVFAFSGDPKQLTWVQARDHFFSDALESLESVVRKALQ
jgi:alpha/beta superfamily hydrolase